MNYLKKVSKLLLSREKKFLVYFSILTLLASLLEILGIGIIIPIIYLFIDKQGILNNETILFFSNILGLKTENQIILSIISILMLTFFLKSFFLTLNYYLQLNYLTKLNVRLLKDFYKNYIYSPWSFIMNKNTGTLIRNLQTGINDYASKIIPYLITLFSEIILTIVLTVFVFYLYPFVSIIAFIILFLIGYVAQKLTKDYNYKLGNIRQKFIALINKHIIQSFRIPKLLKIMGKEDKIIDIFEEMVARETKSKYTQLYIEKLPRIWLEFIFLLIILIALAFFVNIGAEFLELLTLLIVFSLVGFRLLPSINKLLLSIQNLRYASPALKILTDEFENFQRNVRSEKTSQKKIKIDNHNISLKGVSFKYEESNEYIFKNLYLDIKKNLSLAIMGKSGIGKSTLGDLIMGVIPPQAGKILIGDNDINDVRDSWIKCIGYVPQETYILDDTLKANIALGEDENKIDNNKIDKIISLLELDKIVERTEFNTDLVLGDNGVKLSGGQKQRIGIARALYIEPKVLVLDEATSFLDLDTEKKIISILEKLKNKISIIFITHRKSATVFCEKTLDLNNLKNE